MQHIAGLGSQSKNRYLSFFSLPKSKNALIWRKSSFMWVSKRQNLIPTIDPPVVLKVLVHNSALTSQMHQPRDWNIEWCKGDSVYSSSRAEAATSNDTSSGAQQNRPVPAVPLTRFFLCWPWLWFPMPPLSWFLPIRPVLLHSGWDLVSAINTFMLRWGRLSLLLANKNLD